MSSFAHRRAYLASSSSSSSSSAPTTTSTTTTTTPAPAPAPASGVGRAYTGLWRPGTSGPDPSGPSRLYECDRNGRLHQLSPASLALSSARGPRADAVGRVLPQVLYLVETYQVVVVVGDTGSGKSSRIPHALAAAGWAAPPVHTVAVAMPSTVAAAALARWVAKDAGYTLGGFVAFEDGGPASDPGSNPAAPGPATSLVYMPYAALVRESLYDPLLSRYSVIVVDEAHERVLELELLLGLLKQVMAVRLDLRVVVLSATLDVGPLTAFFARPVPQGSLADVTVLRVTGSPHPVDVVYAAAPLIDYVATALDTILWIHRTKPRGDVLMFCTGRPQMDGLAAQLESRAFLDGRDGLVPVSGLGLVVLKLHEGLSARSLGRVFKEIPGARRVILATRVAESGLTLPGVVHVLDSGYTARTAVSVATGAVVRTVGPVSRGEAIQRAGRAGRTGPGTVYRLYTEATYQNLAPHPPPAVATSNLEPLVLHLKALEVSHVAGSPFVAPPDPTRLDAAHAALRTLGALQVGDARLTSDGRFMAAFPLAARSGRAVLAASARDCSFEMLVLVAMLAVEPVWGGKHVRAGQLAFGAAEGDHLTYINVFVAWRTVQPSQALAWAEAHGLKLRALRRAAQIFNHLLALCRGFGVPVISCWDAQLSQGSAPTRAAQTAAGDRLLQAYLRGYANHGAVHVHDNVYRSLTDGSELVVHASSVLSLIDDSWPSLIVYHETEEVVVDEPTARAGGSRLEALVYGGAAAAPSAAAPARTRKTVVYARECSAILSRWLNQANVDAGTYSAPHTDADRLSMSGSASASASASAPAPAPAPAPESVSRTSVVLAPGRRINSRNNSRSKRNKRRARGV